MARAVPYASLTPDSVRDIGRQLSSQYGVRVSGQWRTPEADAVRRRRTGRRAVSDHVYGLALDITGDPRRLDQLSAQLRQDPRVKYVLWRTKDHFDHLHVSFRGRGGSPGRDRVMPRPPGAEPITPDAPDGAAAFRTALLRRTLTPDTGLLSSILAPTRRPLDLSDLLSGGGGVSF